MRSDRRSSEWHQLARAVSVAMPIWAGVLALALWGPELVDAWNRGAMVVELSQGAMYTATGWLVGLPLLVVLLVAQWCGQVLKGAS